jgi:hypothetical protein
MLVKICGITRLEDAEAAVELGAGALGRVLAEESAYVDPERARDRLTAAAVRDDRRRVRGSAAAPGQRCGGACRAERRNSMVVRLSTCWNTSNARS